MSILDVNNIKFKRKKFNGIDELDALYKIKRLNKEYQTILEFKEKEHTKIVKEKDKRIKELERQVKENAKDTKNIKEDTSKDEKIAELEEQVKVLAEQIGTHPIDVAKEKKIAELEEQVKILTERLQEEEEFDVQKSIETKMQLFLAKRGIN